MNPQDPNQQIPDDKREFMAEEGEEGFTLHFGWLVLGLILLGMVWYFGWLKGFLYFLGFGIFIMMFGMVLDYIERDKQ